MKCPQCQADNREGVKFCEECGAKMESICPNCGAIIYRDKKFCGECGHALTETVPKPLTSPEPTSFSGSRYQVKKKLGEGGKKKVYLTHDTKLGRDVAFALIKIENLDDKDRTRITREAQAMGRLGDHPNIVTVYDFGDHVGQPYIVQPVMSSDVW